MDGTSIVFSFLSGLLGSGLAVFIAKEILSKGIQYSFDRELKRFEAELKQTSDSQLEEFRNRFALGATSHMANVAFDNYVNFCEEYMKNVQETFSIVFGPGVREDNISEHAKTLRAIQKK